MELDGQAETQAPHPVQDDASTSAWATPPRARAKRIADSGQASPQLRQKTRRADRHVSATAATWDQGRL